MAIASLSLPSVSDISGARSNRVYAYPLSLLPKSNAANSSVSSDDTLDRPMIVFERRAGYGTSSVHGGPIAIAFPLPAGLQYDDAASWDGEISGQAARIASSIGDNFRGTGAIGTDVQQFGQTVIDQLKAEAGSAGPASAAIAALNAGKDFLKAIPGIGGGVDAAASIALAAARALPNPNVISTFTGSGQRSFSYKFSMVSSSAKESEVINDICKIFRISAYPEGDVFMLRYPPKWNITFKRNNADMQYIPRLFDLYLTAVTTSINPQSGASYHIDGAPIDVDLTVSFKESRVLTANDIKDLESMNAKDIVLRQREADITEIATEQDDAGLGR